MTMTAGKESVRVREPETLPIEQWEDHFSTIGPELAERAFYLVRADLNDAGTFKWRGAEGAVRHYRSQGYASFSTASAGNHAHGLLSAALKFEVPLRIAVPTTAPEQKSQGLVQRWKLEGGKEGDLHVVRVGETFDETLDYMLSEPHPGEVFVHPFDDPVLIKSQGEVLDDILETLPHVTDVIAPVGGGGKLSGMVLRAAELRRSDIRFRAAMAVGSNSLERSLLYSDAEPLEASSPNRRYGGAAVSFIGRHVLSILRQHHYDPRFIETVYNDSVLELAEEYDKREGNEVVALEPTSLLAVAALRQMIRSRKLPDDAVVAVVGTGHNEDYRNLFRTQRRSFKAASGYTAHLH